MSENASFHPLPWYSADLRRRLSLCLHYVSGMLDADLDGEPFFGADRREDGTATAHHALEIGIPHVTGRALDIVYGIEHTTGETIDPIIEDIYQSYLFSCCDLEDFLPVYFDPAREGRPFVEFHNVRECLEALVWRIRLRSDERAKRVAGGMMDTLLSLTAEDTHSLGAEILGSLPPDKAEKFSRIGIPLTMAQGRMVGPLLLYYHATSDPRGLILAKWYSEETLSRCFEDSGLLLDAANNHVHSITSTLSGILSYAILTGREDMIEKIKRIVTVGLREAISSYGYCKEQLWIESEQGESNQVGDLIQIALMLAGRERPAHWYHLAECYLRGGLFPAQVNDTSFMTNHPDPTCDADRGMADRAVGGFGFPNPTCLMCTPAQPVNTIDITQGAAQAMCECTRHILTRQGEHLRLNLWLSWDTPYAEVVSSLPLHGRATLRMKEGGLLSLRIPQNIEEGSFRLWLDGKPRKAAVAEGYAYAGRVEPGAVIEVSFAPRRFQQAEFICHKRYETEWFGEQAVSVQPVSGFRPLFGDFPVESSPSK